MRKHVKNIIFSFSLIFFFSVFFPSISLADTFGDYSRTPNTDIVTGEDYTFDFTITGDSSWGSVQLNVWDYTYSNNLTSTCEVTDGSGNIDFSWNTGPIDVVSDFYVVDVYAFTNSDCDFGGLDSGNVFEGDSMSPAIVFQVTEALPTPPDDSGNLTSVQVQTYTFLWLVFLPTFAGLIYLVGKIT